jgi:alanine-glyoxylate transaminase/serine-glyoxylate transaminase/serine-pyruvate transaminase
VPQTGFFADRWSNTSRAYGLNVEPIVIPERRALDPEVVAKHLAADTAHAIKAVMLIQNETATGMRHPVAEVRAAMNRVGHPALYLVDTISSLRLVRLPHDEWGVDLVIGGSQKGLMLPPGMAFTAINAARMGSGAIRAQSAAATGIGARWCRRASRSPSAARLPSRISTASRRRST